MARLEPITVNSSELFTSKKRYGSLVWYFLYL